MKQSIHNALNQKGRIQDSWNHQHPIHSHRPWIPSTEWVAAWWKDFSFSCHLKGPLPYINATKSVASWYQISFDCSFLSGIDPSSRGVDSIEEKLMGGASKNWIPKGTQLIYAYINIYQYFNIQILSVGFCPYLINLKKICSPFKRIQSSQWPPGFTGGWPRSVSWSCWGPQRFQPDIWTLGKWLGPKWLWQICWWFRNPVNDTNWDISNPQVE